MRPWVGLIGLVLALAVAGGLLRTQLKALRPASPVAGAADAASATGAASAGGTLPQTPAQSSQRLQRQVADDVAKALEQGARRSQGEADR
jgi:hypothetical protein